MSPADRTSLYRPSRPLRGLDLLQHPFLNKGTAFTEEERDALGLRGLLPPRVFTQEMQKERILENLRRQSSDFERYILLTALQGRNERLFYRTLIDHIEEMLPIVYTPTVGEACRRFAHIYRSPRGLYVTARDAGRVESILRAWPEPDVGVIVVTDGERILGLGDLGACGMGIPIGKLTLYTACAGVPPWLCLPVMIDVGTDNEELLRDPLYFGVLERRLRGPRYDALLDEFVEAAGRVFPGAVIQFEDFGNRNAVPLLSRHRERACCFNDDIQGTAAVALAGLIGASRKTGRPLRDETIVFLGAGSAAAGIAELFVAALGEEGVPADAARRRAWMVDSRGLVVSARADLSSLKRGWAQDAEFSADLADIVAAVRPTALIGVSGQRGAFDERVLRALASAVEEPIVFALSNPTANSECTAEEAYRYTDGRAIFASGSPFPPVAVQGRLLAPAQGNNAYIFPGVGLGLLASGARRVTDAMFLAAARALADLVSADSLAQGRVYPPLSDIRRISAAIAVRVGEVAASAGLATQPVGADFPDRVRAMMFDPGYEAAAGR